MNSLAAEPRTALSQQIRAWATDLGFDAVGLAPLGPSAHASAYRRWVEAGHAGEMGYLARPEALAKRENPEQVLPGVRSAVVVALNYAPAAPDSEEPLFEAESPERGIFARYARGEDYHEVMTPRLRELQQKVEAVVEGVGGRAYVDTGPLLERELAERAGLGWFGKNTMLIQPSRGSYFFLGVLLLTVDLDYDEPFRRDHCGRCTRCLIGCPTGALLGKDERGGPQMDARRCISYLTIELKGSIPREMRPLLGNRIYGCDICQEVCPHNNPRFVQLAREEALWPRQGVHGAKLIELMSMDQAEFSRRFRNSPVKRAKRRGLLRNVAVALGNWGSPEAVPALLRALSDEEPLIRGHAAWALGQVACQAESSRALRLCCARALQEQQGKEQDSWVREEVALALDKACMLS